MDRAAAVLASIWAFIGNPQFPVIFITAVIVTAGVLGVGAGTSRTETAAPCAASWPTHSRSSCHT